MTARQLYEAALIEINKLEAPSMLLEDYNYMINKAVQQYTNKVYNRYEINQQATDDMRVLKATTRLEVKPVESGLEVPDESAEYSCVLPENYLHILNCVVQFDKPNGKSGKCPRKNSGANLVFPARKLTADNYPSILVNAYLKPSHTRPYFFITNVRGEDTPSELDSLLQLLGESPRELGSGIKMQIRCGNDGYVPKYAYIDYIKTPAPIILKESDLDLVDGDKSQVLEFPDYVCYEIINEFAKLLLENASDPRLQTNMPINQTIAVPGK